jgi:superfamily II DNA or RNA helicase
MSDMSAYHAFLASKAAVDPPTGLTRIPELPSALFPFQRDLVAWALRRGRAALFAGTGLGKSLMELSWARAVHEQAGHDVLILAPLAVAAQLQREAEKFGLPARRVSAQDECGPGANITNYQKLEHFDLSRFGAVVLDESSILKGHDGKYRRRLIELCKDIPFRLAATATPAPNDFMELGEHAEFLGIMSYTDMLATFFSHDGGDTRSWRLKGHAEDAFWRWMASWAVMLRSPADLGYDAAGYDLPPLSQHQHTVGVPYEPSLDTGLLFPMEAQTLNERRVAARASIAERVAKAVAITPKDEPFVWWCQLNDESRALAQALPDAVEITGSDPEELKEERLLSFLRGERRGLVSKVPIAGFGINMQHCAWTGFVGLNDSWEQVFQAVRRFWRFGQTRPVQAHFIAAETEGAVVANLKRKEADAERMLAGMICHTREISMEAVRGLERDRPNYLPTQPLQLPTWMAA